MKKTHHIAVNLPVQFIKDGNVFVAQCPALDISTQGDTFEEAQKMFDELVHTYIDELIEMGTLEEVLLSCGWTKTPSKKEWIPPSIDFLRHGTQTVNIPCAI